MLIVPLDDDKRPRKANPKDLNQLLDKLQRLEAVNELLSLRLSKLEKKHEQLRVASFKTLFKTKKFIFNLKKLNFFKKPNSEYHVKKETKIEHLKKATYLFFKKSSIHGFPRLTSKRTLVQIIWAILLLLSFATCLISLFNVIKDYFKYNVITKTMIYTDHKELVYPSLTICLPFVTNNLSSIIFNGTINNVSFTDLNFEYFRTLAVVIDKIDCMRLNSFQKNTSDLRQAFFARDILDVQFYMASNSTYPLIYLLENYVNSYLDESPLVLKPGNFYSVHLKQKIHEKLEYPYSNCTRVNDQKYRQVNCISKCLHKSCASYDNCSFPGYYEVKGLKHCHNVDFLRKYEKQCESQCLIECEIKSFSKKVDQVKLLNYHPQKVFCIISFESFKFTRILEIPKVTMTNLFASIGGTLGFYLGFKVLSLFEIIEYLFQIMHIIFS